SDVNLPFASITVLNNLTLNAQALLGDASGNAGSLSFTGDQHFGGNGTVVLGTSGYNLISSSGGGTLTIDRGLTIRGAAGRIQGAITNLGTIDADTPGDSFGLSVIGNNPGLINQGTMRATNGGSLSVGGTWTNEAAGTISADASTLLLGGGNNPWNNLGTISSANGSTVNLNSTFTLANLGNFQRSGGTVHLFGTLTNTGTTLALNAATGSWEMGTGGTIVGGDYSSADGASLVISANSGTFNGVTLDGDLRVAGKNPAAVIKNGATLNGTIYLGDTAGHIGSLLYFGSQTLGGTGSVVFVGASGNGIGPQLLSTSLTIGPGITIRGQSGSISGFGVGSTTIINQGTIAADVAGGTITLYSADLTNQGVLSAAGGGTLNVYNGLVLPMTGTITAGAGGTVAINGNLTLTSTSIINVELAGKTSDQFGRLTVSGATALDGTMNISLVNGYQPALGDAFKVMTYGSEAGQFATINGAGIPNNLALAAAYNTTDLTLTAGPAVMGAAAFKSTAGSNAALLDQVFAELALEELD
ncbi:MAG TPA: hypothetical protein VF278_12810, partial [Pirellulales bacterium]